MKRRTSRKNRSIRRNSRRRTSRKLVGLFPNKARSTYAKGWAGAFGKKPKGYWRLTVKGKTSPRKFRSSAALRAHVRGMRAKGGVKWGWSPV